ncbi:iron chelate uptake ABC transporter family permease subunit [Corynebacterium sp. ES2794-CONJ1]|uniref:FecCD family ABC transporter permease n=1 Tax=unclassified Corynebacterium TaxID=2624378 RepID=UPI0021692F72|nr:MULTISPECIES: iron chelate uptake ABC transporter family permease subunit [unclassified Corynebacterium]MCS4489627.1 iron chelate uptake ABC transporter family permease subunit [Corynebacterium sp. ES2775-CONJ]MCS4491364.1 iron chelate uptake ABC transporter family permease subunit [Corynebacterium sp. ES2715-CONJ3]MCS4531538.1 iron chelate uptake ABC transporter family permease subunit [Corynebacterium sp. ES2730-CONJ]MCU9518935.1 iron chelate uptake ABC transporter family permease subunit 
MSTPAIAPTRSDARFYTLKGIRLEKRSVIVGTIFAAVIATAMIGALSLGEYPMSYSETVANLVGMSEDPLGQFFVRDQRLPRVIAATLVGAGLGVSGCIFQQLSGNPLGSPDIIGFTVGSATGAVLMITLFAASPAAIAVGAAMGGVATASIVYLLARQHKKLSAIRLVLVGIGMASILQALNGLMIVKASLSAAQTAAQWLAGSFNATTWSDVSVAALAMGTLIPIAFFLSRPLSIIISGDELATGLGVRVEVRRNQLIAVGVLLTALAVAVAGPISFVALAAPQISRRMSRSSGVGMGNAALMGAVLVMVSDLLAQRLFAPTQLPVGVVTGLLGGVYLIWLLVQQWRT